MSATSPSAKPSFRKISTPGTQQWTDVICSTIHHNNKPSLSISEREGNLLYVTKMIAIGKEVLSWLSLIAGENFGKESICNQLAPQTALG